MTFSIDAKQEEQYVSWAKEHQKTCNARPDFSCALYSFIFTPSGLGDSVTVKCPCGAKIHLECDPDNL